MYAKIVQKMMGYPSARIRFLTGLSERKNRKTVIVLRSWVRQIRSQTSRIFLGGTGVLVRVGGVWTMSCCS